jgi:hypothetical protein
MLSRISGAQIQGRVEAAGVPTGTVHTVADNRVFPVGPEAYRLIKRAGVTVPPPGELLNMGGLDRQLASAGLQLGERLTVKSALITCGLLRGS